MRTSMFAWRTAKIYHSFRRKRSYWSSLDVSVVRTGRQCTAIIERNMNRPLFFGNLLLRWSTTSAASGLDDVYGSTLGEDWKVDGSNSDSFTFRRWKWFWA